MFEYAARNKLRFPYKGMISVEDLWDLNVRELDSIFKTLNAQVKKSQEESLLATKSKEDEVLTTQIDIVKHIVRIKQDEEAARLFAKERKEKQQKLMELINKKQDEDLNNKSIEELKAMLAELE
jgi:hypothetical protein